MKKYYGWLAALAILTVIFGTMYGTSQQTLRLGGYDPGTGNAEAVATLLDKGQNPKSFTGQAVELSTSLQPFIIIYDKSGKPINGDGFLNSKPPTIPMGVLTHATSGKDNFVTWQPQKGVRLAATAVKAKDYYVVGGRSLREVEKREATVLKLAGIGWLVSVLILAAAFVASHKANWRRAA